MYVYDTKTGKEFVLPDMRGMRYAVCGKKPRNTPTYTSEHFKSTKGVAETTNIIYHRTTGKEITPLSFKPNNAPTYASVFFENNQKQPPVVVIPKKPKETNDQHIKLLILDHFQRSVAVGSDVITCYLSSVLKKDTVKSKEKWMSFGVKICEKEEDITPLSLIKIEEGGSVQEIDKTSLKSEDDITDDRWLVMMIFGLYRISISPTLGNYRDTLSLRLKSLGSSITHKWKVPNPNVALGWERDSSFLSLAAACDMFWNKHPESSFSLSRFGTIITRSKDSSIISSIIHMTNVANMNLDDLMDWIFDKTMGDEFRKIFKPDEELDYEFSYVHYISALRLALKSPYSATESPMLHIWIHMTCALLGSTRSICARIPEEVGLPKIRIFATLVAFSRRETVLKPKNKGQNTADSASGIEETSGEYWYMKFISNGSKLTTEQTDFYNERAEAMKTGVRERTIGEWISKNKF